MTDKFKTTMIYGTQPLRFRRSRLVVYVDKEDIARSLLTNKELPSFIRSVTPEITDTTYCYVIEGDNPYVSITELKEALPNARYKVIGSSLIATACS